MAASSAETNDAPQVRPCLSVLLKSLVTPEAFEESKMSGLSSHSWVWRIYASKLLWRVFEKMESPESKEEKISFVGCLNLLKVLRPCLQGLCLDCLRVCGLSLSIANTISHVHIDK